MFTYKIGEAYLENAIKIFILMEYIAELHGRVVHQ